MAVTILLADDHEVVRQGLRTILKARPEWQISGEAGNGQEAVDATKALRPDVIILDITMPVMSGLDAAQEIARLNLGTLVLIFTMHDSRSLIKAVRKAGARGYVVKSRASRDLIAAVDTLLAGGTFFGPDLRDETPPEKDESRGPRPVLRQAVRFAS